MQHLAPSSPAAPPTRDDGCTIARLGAEHRGELLALFLRLPLADRRSRFNACLGDAALAGYVEAIDFDTALTFAARSGDGRLVAVAEGIVCAGAGARTVEAAFATDVTWRRLGLAKRLFRAVARCAASAGIDTVVASCDARNAAMRSLLRSTDAITEPVDGEICASWPLPAPAPAPAPHPARHGLTVVARAGIGAAATPALAFARSVEVGEEQTARRLFATLPHGAAYAQRLVPALATGILVATIESVCILEMQPLLGTAETVVGTNVDVRHLAPALPGHMLRLRGSGRWQGRGRMRFEVVVDDGQEPVATATVELTVVHAARFDSRLARKATAARDLEAIAA